ncbi:MAG: hypothetical protein WDN76_05980 [Alphaproteobacteria bacterium]
MQGQNGETLYTTSRQASTLSADGQLQTTAGQPVLSESGAPLVFDTRDGPPIIDKDGIDLDQRRRSRQDRRVQIRIARRPPKGGR